MDLSYFGSPIQAFQYYDKYSRYDDELDRRENWPETVKRVVKYLAKLSEYRLTQQVYKRIYDNILNLKVMPSMRLVAMAGKAADRTNVCLYNCAFVGVSCIEAFCEALLISMSGCGVGYSVEKRYVNQLPYLPDTLHRIEDTHVIEDSTEGWYNAIHTHLSYLFDGAIINFDYSKIRPAGSILKTKGGRASGPKPLKDSVDFITAVFVSAVDNKQERLSPIEVHDIMCSLGQAAVSGGVRRTAMLSLFDYDDEDMLSAKTGEYNNYRWNANNSFVWDEDLTRADYDKIMQQLFNSHNGEPGFWSRLSLKHTTPERRNIDKIAGPNPCGEINLRDMQFCNLTNVICRNDDTVNTLIDKIEVASIIGTIQSMATHFPGLRPQWKENCEEERLLGIGLSGQMDCPVLVHDNGSVRSLLRDMAVGVNNQFSTRLGINPSTSVTCIKPDGNSSQLLDCASGMHPRYAKYYIRNVRVAVTSPVYKTLFASGLPVVPENGQSWNNMDTAVIPFPVRAPEGALLRDDLSSIDMLEYWKLNKIFYTEHNPSVTIHYKPEEWEDIKEWLWTNREIAGGITLLPYSDANYGNMPYAEISEEEYDKYSARFPKIRWELLPEYELEDMTTSSQELACAGGHCLI